MISFNNTIKDFEKNGIPFSANPADTDVSTTILNLLRLMETKKKSNFRSILNTKQALILRQVCSEFTNFVSDVKWYDVETPSILGNFANWRMIFPKAIGVNLNNREDITDDSLKILSGIHTLNAWNCNKITDAGLSHLKGIHTLNISGGTFRCF
jgi:hypothetical protein